MAKTLHSWVTGVHIDIYIYTIHICAYKYTHDTYIYIYIHYRHYMRVDDTDIRMCMYIHMYMSM